MESANKNIAEVGNTTSAMNLIKISPNGYNIFKDSMIYYNKKLVKNFMNEINMNQTIALVDKNGKEIEINSFEAEEVELWV